ncbi:MAG: TonB family protein [Vicinamibacteria bacterium]
MGGQPESARPACPTCNAENEPGAESCFTCGASLFRSPATISRGSLIAARYEVRRCLGAGGMGVVFEAHDRVLDETVAVKTLRADAAESPEVRRRFLSEIKLARKVRHDNVCGIHEYGDEEGLRYITMEFVEGVDLRRVLRRRGRLPLAEAFQVALQVARGLQAIHEAGIIHRDLKSTNIMLDAHGVVRVMDFGLAKQSGVDTTLLGAVMGTPEYMSPEQARGQRVDYRCDIYALGIVIYEVFTGAGPFRGDTPVAVIAQHLNDPPPLEGPAAAALPRPLVPVLRRALAKDPADRYQTIDTFIAALERARAECSPFVGPTPSRPGRPPTSVRTVVPDGASPTLSAEERTLAAKKTLREPVAPPPSTAMPPRWVWLAAGGGLALSAIVAAGVVARLRPAEAPARVAPPAPLVAGATPRPDSSRPVIDTPPPRPSEAAPEPARGDAAPRAAEPSIRRDPKDAERRPATIPEPPAVPAVVTAAPEVAAPAGLERTPAPEAKPAAETPVSPREPVAWPGTAPLAPLPGSAGPEYPPEMLAKGVEGVVVLKIVVSETGTVSEVQVLAGNDPFAAAAATAIRRWRYPPPIVDGRPTPVFFLLRVPFRLSPR